SREPILLPGENNFAPPLMPNTATAPSEGMIINAADVTNALGVTTGTVTISAADALKAVGLMDYRGDLIGLPASTNIRILARSLIGFSVEVKQGSGEIKLRFITGVIRETDPFNNDDILTLSLNKPWETVSTETNSELAALFTNTFIPNQ